MENDKYIFWYYNPECQAFISDMIKDLNEQSQQYYSSPEKWENCSYHNDSCGSVHYNLDNDTETYVQLFAFHNQEEATKEGVDERFSIEVSINGETEIIGGEESVVTNDREEAIKQALEAVSALSTKFWEEENNGNL
tara:strand:- start:506 stop:916 length:411 start_codon:yes stop_codon:yes gene_type:complete